MYRFVTIVCGLFLGPSLGLGVTQPSAAQRPSAAKPSAFVFAPLVLQERDYTCGVAAFRSILQFYGLNFSEVEVMKLVHPTPNDGTMSKNIVSTAKALGFEVTTQNHATIDQLTSLIDQGLLPIILFQAWGTKPNPDWANEWNEGHYAVVTGYDQTNLYFMDPVVKGTYGSLTKSEFLVRWHDLDGTEKVEQFFMVIQPSKFGGRFAPFEKIQ